MKIHASLRIRWKELGERNGGRVWEKAKSLASMVRRYGDHTACCIVREGRLAIANPKEVDIMVWSFEHLGYLDLGHG